MLDQLPGGIGQVRRALPANLCRDAIDCGVEADVCILPNQEPAQLLPEQGIILHHFRYDFAGLTGHRFKPRGRFRVPAYLTLESTKHEARSGAAQTEYD